MSATIADPYKAAVDEMLETLNGMAAGFAENAATEPGDSAWRNGAALLTLAKACVYRSMLPMTDAADADVELSQDGRLFVELVTARLLGGTPTTEQLRAAVRTVGLGVEVMLEMEVGA
jgi:hypothetical protein